MRLPPPSGAKPSVGSTSEAVSQARRLQRETGVTACKHLRDLSHRAEVLLLPVLPQGFQGGFVTASRTQHVRNPSERNGRQLTRYNRAFRRFSLLPSSRSIVALHANRSRTAIRRRLFMAPSSDHVLYNQIEDE